MDMKVKRREGRCVEGKEGGQAFFLVVMLSPSSLLRRVCSAKNICASDEEQRQKRKVKKRTEIEEDKGNGGQEIGWGVHQSETSKKGKKRDVVKDEGR